MEVITVITPHVEHVPDDDSSFFWGKTHHFSRSFPWFSPCFNQGLQPEGLAAAARTRDTRDTRGGGGGDGKTHGKPWENPWGIFQENHGKTGMTGDD